MRQAAHLGIVLLLCQAYASGQRGTAESGYYPLNYAGAVFVGNLTSANDETREITLTYTNPANGETETFGGILEEGYMIRGKDDHLRELRPSNLKMGARIKVYYIPKTRKVDGKKVKVNSIFLIGGLPNRAAGYSSFKAFPGSR